MTLFRRCALLLVAGLCMLGSALAVSADEIRSLRIGTGATGGTYFTIGGLIASVVSNPPGSRDCADGGRCGVPGVLGAAVSTEGSVENVQRVAAGELDLALSQADVAYDAYTGRAPFADAQPLRNLRAIANLYPEALHLLVRRDSGIASVPDLAGRRVSLGEARSGTRVLAGIVLEAYGLSEDLVQPRFAKLGPAVDALLAGDLDALFVVGGYPIDAIVQAAESGKVVLLSIKGRQADRIRAAYDHIGADVISAGTYPGLPGVVTLKSGAVLVTSDALDAELVYALMRALWHERHRDVLDNGHPHARLIRLHTSLDGVPIPLHPGAARFYREVGLLQVCSDGAIWSPAMRSSASSRILCNGPSGRRNASR